MDPAAQTVVVGDPEAPLPSPGPAPPRHGPLRLFAIGAAVLAGSAMLGWSSRGRPNQAAGPASPIASAEAPGAATGTARAGWLAYQVHCARCHGSEGRGDGPDAPHLHPAPGDLKAGPWKHGATADAVRAVVARGLPGTPMTAWSATLSPADLDAVVAHVLSLAPTTTDLRMRPSPASLLRRAGFVAGDPPQPAPPLAFDDLEGGRRTLESRRGKLVLVAFWGTSCVPCLDELPELARLADEFGDAGLAVLPICVDETDPALIRGAAGPKVARLPLYRDRTGTARLNYDVQALPTTFLIDRDGRLIAHIQGAARWSGPEVRDLLRICLAGPALEH